MSAANSFPYPVLYARLPGLMVGAIAAGNVPRAVVQDRTVRDCCRQAYTQGVRVGEPVSRARRQCPLLLTLPIEDLDPRLLKPLSHRFLDVLADLSSMVEPDGPDAAFIDLTGGPLSDIAALSLAWRHLQTDFAPILGLGTSRNAARACAECALPAERLTDAAASFLWPEDTSVASRLFRLGLDTYGAVAAIGESGLVYQFGKQGRQLYARSIGHDFTPVRASYPPPQVRHDLRFPLDPLSDEGSLRHHLESLAKHVGCTLRDQGRHARRLHLTIQTERETHPAEWVLPAAAQADAEIYVSLRRLRQQITITAPVVALTVEALDLDLPAATTGSLFDNRATERKLSLAVTRQKLRSRYGTRALRYLAELPLPRRETRNNLRREALRS